MLELKQTIPMMDNADYKERFKAEYYQVAIRLEKLKTMVDKWDRGVLEFTPTCPRATYDFQIDAMEKYKGILEIRASIENIELNKKGE